MIPTELNDKFFSKTGISSSEANFVADQIKERNRVVASEIETTRPYTETMRVEAICETWNDEPYTPTLCVEATCKIPYKDSENYLCHRNDSHRLEAHTLTELYETMGRLVSAHIVRGEKDEALYGDWYSPSVEYSVEFSDIFVQVARYDELKMKDSKSYQAIGVVRECARLEKEKAVALQIEQRKLWQIEETKRKDKAEWERLQKIFNPK